MEETKNKQAEPQEWLMPDEIEIIETSDPKFMLDKWLAEPVLRKWTEDFVDECTGELVSVEHTEPIITTGTYCSQDIVQLITFHLQAGDIETVKVSERPPLNKRTDLLTMNYIVSVGSMLPQTEYIYVAGVQTPEEAAKVVTDYCKVYSAPNIVGDFTVNDCQLTPIIYLYDHQASLRTAILEPRTKLLEHVEDETPRPAFTENLRFWNVSVTKWSFSAWEGWKPYKQTICTEAYDMSQAVEIVESWANRLMAGTDIESWIVDVTKVGKSKITHVIPYTYLRLWRSKNPIKKEGRREMSEQAKKYPKPEEQEAIDQIMDLANQWCNMDKNGGRGAMVMLTDERGTHYQFVGNQERNTRAAVDILTANDMFGAGRAVQIAFLKAMLFIKFDNAQQKAGMNIWDIEDYAERRAAAIKLPEYMEMVEKTRKLNEELKKLWQEK